MHTLLAVGSGLVSQTAPASPGCTIEPTGVVSGLCRANGSLHISVDYRSILAPLVLSIGALALLTISAVLPKRSRPGLYAALTVVVGGAATVAAIWQWYDVGKHGPQAVIGGQVFYDRFGVLFLILVSVATMLSAVTSESYLRREGLDGVEAYVLILMAGTGAMLMAESGGLIMLFLGLEIMSIALYVMAAYHRRRTQSGEAGFKYFILGSFSSAIFLYGIALVYGATGSTMFGNIAVFLARNSLPNDGVLLAGMGLLIVGLAFKVSAVPFHFWSPDVYQGSPTPFTGYMAAVAKAAGFAGLIRVLYQALGSQQANWRPAIWFITVLSLLVGSVVAIAQKDLKRMLAYSSISQAGFVLVGVEAASATGNSAALFYLFTYTFIIIGTFGVVQLVEGRGEARTDLGAIRGLGRREPLVAGAMLIFMLAQAGIPLTSGFLGKFYVIQAAEQRGQFPLALIAMLTAVIAAFAYLRVALVMYAGRGATPAGYGAEAVGAGPGAAELGVPVIAGAAVEGPDPVGGAAGAGSGGDDGPGSSPAGPEDASTAGLEPVLSLDGPSATAALEAPPTGRILVPPAVGVVLFVCAAFTIFAGVSPLIIDFARSATTIF